jgi:di/tricarboxylate transporter
MLRFIRIVIHLSIMAAGVAAVAFTDFWNWDLFHNLVLPIVSAGFFFYLVLFLATGEYRVFRSSD